MKYIVNKYLKQKSFLQETQISFHKSREHQIPDLLYFHFIKIIKGPGTSFQYPALSQKHVKCLL